MEGKRTQPSSQSKIARKNRAEVMARVQYALGALITLSVALLWGAGWTSRIEFPLVDEYMRRLFSSAPPPSSDLCIIAIDDNSLINSGRWPWPRDQQAIVIDELRRAGAKVIALDLLLNNPEPGPRLDPVDISLQDRLSPSEQSAILQYGPPVEAIQRLLTREDQVVAPVLPDTALAASFGRAGNVILGAEFTFEGREGPPTDDDPERSSSDHEKGSDPRDLSVPFDDVYTRVKADPAVSLEALKSLLADSEDRDAAFGHRIEELERKRKIAGTLISRTAAFSIPLPAGDRDWVTSNAPELPAPTLFDSAYSIGNVSARGIADSDGVVRRMQLWIRHDDRLYPTLGLAAAASYLGVPIASLRIEGNQTVIPAPRGDIRIEMHRAPMAGHAPTDGLIYLAWPTGRGSDKQFNPYKRIPAVRGTAAAPSDVDSAAAECGEKEFRYAPGEEIPIGGLMEPRLVERRVKANLLEFTRKFKLLWRMGEAYVTEELQVSLARAKRLQSLSADDPEWRALLAEQLKLWSEARDQAQFFVESFKEIPDEDLSPVEREQKANISDVLRLIDDAARNVRCGLARIDQVRQALRMSVGGRLCLMGWVATGSIADFVPSSIDVKTPGPYLHAAVINTVLTGHQKLVSDSRVRTTGYIATLLLGAIGTIIGVRMSVLLSPVALALSICCWVVLGGFLIWDRYNWVSAFSTPALSALLSWLGVTLHRLLVEQRGRKQTEARFRSYVSPEVVDILVNDPDLQSMVPQRKELTIMFSDVANWTTLTERLGTEGIFKFLNTYLREMTDILQKNRATLDKYLGDGIMAFWGAPIDDPDHARNASIACVEMMQKLADMNAKGEFGDAGSVEVRFGLATGEVNVGDFGNPPNKSAYTVIGDAVNLAARLESSNKQFGSSILMTRRVIELSGSTLLFRPIGRIVVKGKTEYDELFELVGDRRPKGDRTAEWVELTRDAVNAYQRADLSAAESMFQRLDREFADSKLAKLYLHAIEELRASGVPDGWEGTVVLTEK